MSIFLSKPLNDIARQNTTTVAVTEDTSGTSGTPRTVKVKHYDQFKVLQQTRTVLESQSGLTINAGVDVSPYLSVVVENEHSSSRSYFVSIFVAGVGLVHSERIVAAAGQSAETKIVNLAGQLSRQDVSTVALTVLGVGTAEVSLSAKHYSDPDTLEFTETLFENKVGGTQTSEFRPSPYMKFEFDNHNTGSSRTILLQVFVPGHGLIESKIYNTASPSTTESELFNMLEGGKDVNDKLIKVHDQSLDAGASATTDLITSLKKSVYVFGTCTLVSGQFEVDVLWCRENGTIVETDPNVFEFQNDHIEKRLLHLKSPFYKFTVRNTHSSARINQLYVLQSDTQKNNQLSDTRKWFNINIEFQLPTSFSITIKEYTSRLHLIKETKIVDEETIGHFSTQIATNNPIIQVEVENHHTSGRNWTLDVSSVHGNIYNKGLRNEALTKENSDFVYLADAELFYNKNYFIGALKEPVESGYVGSRAVLALSINWELQIRGHETQLGAFTSDLQGNVYFGYGDSTLGHHNQYGGIYKVDANNKVASYYDNDHRPNIAYMTSEDVLFCSSNQLLKKLTPNLGLMKSIDTGHIVENISVKGDYLYACLQNGDIRKYDHNLTEQWSVNPFASITTSWSLMAAADENDNVYVAADGNLKKLDENGVEDSEWSFSHSGTNRALVYNSGHLFITTTVLRKVSVETQEDVWTVTLDGNSFGVGVAQDGTSYAGTAAGRFMRVDSDGNVEWDFFIDTDLSNAYVTNDRTVYIYGQQKHSAYKIQSELQYRGIITTS